MRIRLPWVLGLLVLASACSSEPSPAAGSDERVAAEYASAQSALVGVPQNGFPDYQERLMLVAINRARSDPNNTTLGIAGTSNGGCTTQCASGVKSSTCFTALPVQKPLMLSYNGSRAARFHSQNLLKNSGTLSHNSFCTLRSDVASTGCDGSASCACEAGTAAFSCSGSGAGTDPWTRCGLFGFTANGEVLAAGQSDGWAAAAGWIGECANYEGHRNILLSATANEIGLGSARGTGGCWQSFYGGDTAKVSGSSLAVLPGGVHRPESGTASTTFSFYANYYDAGGAPKAIYAVIDGTCVPMTQEAGVSGTNATYKATRSVGAGCHQYWFLARDSQNVRRVYPEAGAWGVGDSASCTGYQATATAADCETTCEAGISCTSVDGCQLGTTACTSGTPVCADLSNRPDGTPCGSGRVCSSGACVTAPSPGGTDAGSAGPDAGAPPRDAGSAGGGGTAGTNDAGSWAPAGDATAAGEDASTGWGCSAAGGAGGLLGLLPLLVSAGVLVARRRRLGEAAPEP